MSFTFKTEVIGLMCDVEGAFDEIGLFDIHSIKHFGCELELSSIDGGVLCYVSEEAVKQATKAAVEAEQDSLVRNIYKRGMMNDYD